MTSVNGTGSKSRLALIPARAGSKRLPNKNILPFDGRPMLAWTVNAALKAECFERVYVSSDSAEILAIAEENGASGLKRPDFLSDDKAGLIDVLKQFLEIFPNCSEVCLLLPNCPLRCAEDIVGALKLFERNTASGVLSVVDYGWTPPFRALQETAHGVEFLMKEWQHQKSQTYPVVKCPTGAVYWARREAVENVDSLYITGLLGYELPWHRGIDIDTSADLILARAIRHCLNTGFDFAEGRGT